MDAIGCDDWAELWDARVAALSQVLGEPDDVEFHAADPLFMGGHADVISFSKAVKGIAYVTSDLTGRPGESVTDYELMICEREPSEWSPYVISRLAQYAIKNAINSGESMDIESATPADSKIKALVFHTYATFNLYDQDLALRLCIGITTTELAFKLQHGSGALLNLLKRHSIYPFTDLGRDSIPLPDFSDSTGGGGN